MRTKVLVPGTFDMLHYGHMRFLKECAKLGLVTVALATDEHASKRKPIMNYVERKEALLHLPYVRMVTAKKTRPLMPLILATNATVICYGSDWTKNAWMEMNALTEQILGRLINIDIVEVENPQVISTTKIIERARLSA